MLDSDLPGRIEALRSDYEATTGKPCRNFFCPILGRDEYTELCRGHMIALGPGDIWVPQRKDVDNFYGSVVEADLAAIIEDGGRDPWELLLDPELRRKHRLTMQVGGEQVQYYFPKPEHQRAQGHTFVEVRDREDRSICNIGIKVSPDRFLVAPDMRVELVVEGDYMASVIASMLKAAHLTMFHMLGYDHVFSPTGINVGLILKDFFEQHNGSHAVSEEAVERAFRRHASMVAPVMVHGDDWLLGTATDKMLLACFAATRGMFAIGVIVKVRSHRFCVFLPTETAIDTYYSFLAEPPPFITARYMRFCDGSDGQVARWEMEENTRRIPLNQPVPAAA